MAEGMNAGKLFKRFLIPATVVSIYYYLKEGCFVSPKAEVELNRNLRIGAKSIVSSFTKIKARNGPLRIGSHVHISTGCEINSGPGGVSIGDDCLLGSNVSVIGSNYRYDSLDTPIRLQGISSKGIEIGNNVWIGSGARILDGSIIGKGSIVTPNSVVSAKIPENSIAQGNPARIIFTRRS